MPWLINLVHLKNIYYLLYYVIYWAWVLYIYLCIYTYVYFLLNRFLFKNKFLYIIFKYRFYTHIFSIHLIHETWTTRGRTSNLNFPQWSLLNPIKVCHSKWYSGKINFRFDCKIIFPSIKIWSTMYSDSQMFYILLRIV